MNLAPLPGPLTRSTPLRFVFILGIVSLFADMTYEGGRSVTGPFLAQLGATGLIVGLVAGFGELIGYGLRILSGTVADRTGRYWPIAFLGYAVNLLCVPALALVQTVPAAAGLLIGERFGRGARKPVVSAMIAHAGSQIGQGWVFGFHEAMDQVGATIGPLLVAAILALGGGFGKAFGALAIPALLALIALSVARREYPSPRDLESASTPSVAGFGRAYWIYVIAGACTAAGFADFALVAFHLSKSHLLPNHVIPILYAAAMLVGAICAPFFGRLYDRFPLATLIGAFAVAAAFAPLSFLGAAPLAIAGVLLWGLGMGAQETLLPSVVAKLTPADRRATALGTFDGFYGFAWFAGSVAMGALYDRSLLFVAIFSLALQFAALPLFIVAARMSPAGKGGKPEGA